MDSGPGDEVLLAAVAGRDMGAFRMLYERHAGWLAVRLARRCNDGDLVADAVQDTFVAVWQRPRGFRGDGDVAAWLWGIAIRRLVSRLRTRGSVAAGSGHAGAAPAAEDLVLLSVEYGDAGQALARLSPEMRAVIQAVMLDGLTAREAAQLLRVPVSSVKTRLYRAKGAPAGRPGGGIVMTGWHLDDDMLRRYAGRAGSLAEGASAEQHLLSCAPCRARVTAAASVTGRSVIDFAAVGDRTRDAVEVPRASVFERLLRGAGLPAQEARLVAVASAFRGVWLAGVAAVLAFAAVAAATGHARGAWLFLAVAPVVPCLVVAAGYDPWLDPALEPELVTPYPALRLVLLRTITVLALALPAVLVFGLVVPGQAAFAWLLPAVGFVAVVLAASTWVSPLRSAIAVSSAWLAAIWLLATRLASPDAVLQARIQAGFLALAAASFVIFLVRRRRRRLRQLRPWR
jgi:RNA polymerase sigma factor (sigma-70 family)